MKTNGRLAGARHSDSLKVRRLFQWSLQGRSFLQTPRRLKVVSAANRLFKVLQEDFGLNRPAIPIGFHKEANYYVRLQSHSLVGR
jgi:hypothetical protein